MDLFVISAHYNFQIIVDRQKRAFTWGFGGYGRLGHNEQKDEWVPRLLSMFVGPNRGVASVAAGSTFTMAVGELGIDLIIHSLYVRINNYIARIISI